jgi:polar amino acid transport system substrate-binding protein
MHKNGGMIRVSMFLGILFCTVFGAQAQAPNPSSNAAPQNLVLVGTSLTLAPYSFINEKGESVGFELDILKTIGERLGLQFQYVRMPFSQMFTSLNAGIFRVLANGTLQTCERLKNPQGVGRFTVPTYTAGMTISTRKENADKVKSFDDLVGKKVGVENVGSIGDRFVIEVQKKLSFEKVVFADNPSLFLGLEQGRVDAVAQTEFATRYQIRGNPNIAIAAVLSGTSVPGGFIFRDGDPMREQFNKVLNEMKADGTLAKIYREWFKQEAAPDSVTNNVVPEVTLASRGCPQ